MSEVTILRTQILENLEILNYPDLTDRRFALIWDGLEEWIVFLEHLKPLKRHEPFVGSYYGKGITLEEAYDRLGSRTIQIKERRRRKEKEDPRHTIETRLILFQMLMGEISDLRAQILDKIQTLNSDFEPDSRFVLTCNIDDGSENYGKGTGETPEAAYKDLLKQTAMELDDRGYTITQSGTVGLRVQIPSKERRAETQQGLQAT
ncbi:hypothetical protein KCU64_g8165, partial [Aureobasidium melanogenum]